ncbi:MAG: DEAD/DEAH box helicase family protein [Promethearchaeota archaeon]
MKLTPRDYQVNARDQIISSINDGFRRIIVYLPTGMGKTLISFITIEYLIEEGYIGEDDKVLFLVADRKLKHQLNDMASKAGLGNYGNLFVLPEGQDYPARLVRQHAAMSRFIFATPVLLINSLIARSRATQKLDKSILSEIKVVVVDEVLDVLAQSYGKKRTREETVSYIMKLFNVDDYELFLQEVAARYEITPKQVDQLLSKEFSPKFYRINKKFEPVLSILKLLDPTSDIIMIGLTASISQEKKREFLKENLGGKDVVREIIPVGDEYENYRPSIVLKKIRVIDDFISNLDNLIQEIKNAALIPIKSAYRDVTNMKYLPSDRIMLFVTELLSKKEMKDTLREKLARRKMDKGTIEDTIKRYITSASAYLLVTVGRQKLLENTFSSFYRFVKGTKNSFLLSNDAFKEINELVSVKIKEFDLDSGKAIISEKDKKLLYWVKRFVKEGKKVLVMCRFINMVNHLHEILNDPSEGNVNAVKVYGKMDGVEQNRWIRAFKEDPGVDVLIASERLIEKGTDLPETDVGVYYGSTISLERYEQSLGRIRSNVINLKTAYTIAYNLTVEAEKSSKRDAAFLELLERGSKKGLLIVNPDEDNK